MGNPLGGLSDFVERLGDVGNYIFRAFNDHGKTLTKRLQRCLIPWLAKKFNWITLWEGIRYKRAIAFSARERNLDLARK
jgi:hypothetical protein